MKAFKTHEELIEFVSNQGNIETLANGEITLKDWSQDFRALGTYLKEYRQAASDRQSWESQKEEMTQRVAELTEQLDSAHDELAGLKEIHSGDDKEMLQRLNAEIARTKAENVLLKKQVATIPDLRRQIDEWNFSRIVEAAKKAATCLKVPQNIIDDSFFEKGVVTDLTIDEIGNVFVKGDCSQSVHDYIATKQKDRPHWQPLPNGNSHVPDGLAVIASLFSQGGSSGTHTRQIYGDDRISDDMKAIAALFG